MQILSVIFCFVYMVISTRALIRLSKKDKKFKRVTEERRKYSNIPPAIRFSVPFKELCDIYNLDSNLIFTKGK